jgi:alkaline phosphatase D
MASTESADGGISRREFHLESLGALTTLALAPTLTTAAPEAASTANPDAPRITCGVASGDVTSSRAILWSRSDRPARMVVEMDVDESFAHPRTLVGPETGPQRDFTAKLEVRELSAGQTYFYRVTFQDLGDPRVLRAPQVGQFKTASAERADVRFLWSADTAGQGYGIDPSRGGMAMYRTMAALQPDFFLHCGDNIYADNPIPESIPLDDGTTWRNIVTPETSKVAETQDEFHGRYRYNWQDEHFQRFHAATPIVALWDDHETLNNWYPGEQLDGDERYRVKDVSLLASRAKAAFFDYLPVRESPSAPARIERVIPYGPHLDLFCLDMRSFRGPNNGRRPDGTEDWNLLGRRQLDWLKRRLKASTATWKVICSDMPIGLIVGDGPDGVDAVAAGNGPPAGRELEIAELLKFLKDEGVENTVWLTGDVHYAASHYYDPAKAVYQDFLPFWEFTSGPIHAGTFGPNKLDNTFGPEVRFQSIPDQLKANRPPSEGLQFCGEVRIDGASGVMTVAHYNVAGEQLWSIDLTPQSV